MTRNRPASDDEDEDDEDNLMDHVPTIEEAAVYIWNEVAGVEKQLKDLAAKGEEEEANQPGTKWAAENGKLTFELPTAEYAGFLSTEEYPYTGAAVACGLLEAPYPRKAYVNEATAPLSELHSAELTRAQKAALHYILKITEVAGDGGELTICVEQGISGVGLMPDSEWWQSELSDDERRALPAKLHAAYRSVLAKIEELQPHEKPTGMRAKKDTDERYIVELWNMLVDNEGGKVPSYDGADLNLELPEVIVKHPKMAAAFAKPAVVAAMRDGPGILVAPFDAAVGKALLPPLKSIIKDAAEPRRTRAAAIMVEHWMEDFEEDCELPSTTCADRQAGTASGRVKRAPQTCATGTRRPLQTSMPGSMPLP